MAVIDDLLKKHREGKSDEIDKARISSFLEKANKEYRETCEKITELLDSMVENYKTEMQELDMSFCFVARSMGDTNVVALMGTERDAFLAMGAVVKTIRENKEKENENG